MAKNNDSQRTIRTGSLLVPRISGWIPMPPGVAIPGRPSTEQTDPSGPSSEQGGAMANSTDSNRARTTDSLVIPPSSLRIPMPLGAAIPVRPTTKQTNPLPSSVMSTKNSLKYEHDEATGQQVHLYEDVFDEEHVYLELEGFPVEVASSVALSGQGQARVAIRIPNAWARKLGLLKP
jgi:hypothetical protein